MNNDLNYVKIGQRIKALRLEHGLTQDELRDGIDVSKTHMSHIETGSTKLSLPALVQIANRLGTTPDNLLMDNITTPVPAFRRNIEVLIEDCTPYELQAMIEAMVLIKKTIRNIPQTTKRTDMLDFYLSMVKTEEDANKVIFIYNNFYSSMAYAAGLILNHNKHDVEDVVHSAMIKLIENISIIDLSDVYRAKNLCKRVARNKAIDFCKKRDNQTISFDEAIAENIESDNNPLDIIINKDIYEIILHKIETLDDKYRDICSLKYINNLKEREIALLLDMSPKTVSTRIFRGKQLLREALRKENIYV